jgi:hypothetical protein
LDKDSGEVDIIENSASEIDVGEVRSGEVDVVGFKLLAGTAEFEEMFGAHGRAP